MPETFTCVVCGASGAGTLSKHMQIHTDLKPYACPELLCNRRFKRKHDLTRHMRVHTGEKPYECDECGKAFQRKTQLSEHKRVHTGEERYKCDECGRAFSQSHSLKEHKQLHINPESRTCSECGKFFTHPNLLINHMLTHSDKKSYECADCNRIFTNANNLNRHKNIKHQNQSTTPSITVENHDSRNGPVTTFTHHSPDSDILMSCVNSESGTATVLERPVPGGKIVTVNQSKKDPLTKLVADFWSETDSNHTSPGSDTVTEYVPSNPEDATVVTPEENRATMNPGTPGFSFNDLPEHLSPPEDPDEELDTDKLFPDSLFPDSPLSGNPC